LGREHTSGMTTLYFFFSFSLGKIGVWTQGFMLAKHTYSLSLISSPFCSGYFRDRVTSAWPEGQLNVTWTLRDSRTVVLEVGWEDSHLSCTA
jgi:hypothetical protein